MKKRKSNLSVTSVVFIILLIMAGGAFYLWYTGKDKLPKDTDLQVQTSQELPQVENITMENVTEENKEKDDRNITQTPEDKGTEVVETEENGEAKAKKIVQNDWGTDDTVYFSMDGLATNGDYIISVRDKQTTKQIAKYIVNTTKGTFKIE